jgi:hypothetical protein
MWSICIKFEEDMKKAGIKGKSITKSFEENIFEEEIWNFYEVNKWFPEEEFKRRFILEGEENLDEMDILTQLGKKKGRIKERVKRKGRKKKKPPDKDDAEESLSIRRNKKPPDKKKGLLDALYGLTVMRRQSDVEAFKSKDDNLSSGNLEVLIKMKAILKTIIAVLWDAEITRSSKSFRFAWEEIIYRIVDVAFEEVKEKIRSLFEEVEKILVRCKKKYKERVKGISTSNEGDCRKISVARGQ